MMNLNLKVLIAIYLLGSGRCKELVMQAGTCVFPKKKKRKQNGTCKIEYDDPKDDQEFRI
jgi:hypothetical protein